jgi:glycosyltransferase involved in cell wall biosynthesis
MDFEPQKIIVKAWSYHGLFSMIATRLKYLPLKLKVPSVIATIEYWLMDNSVFTRAEKIICSTWASYKFHKAKFGGKVVYIPPPMESPLITEKKSTKKLRVLFVSRDLSIQRKNLTTLFKALNALNEEHLRRVKVILVGRNAHKFKDWFNWLKMRAVEVDVIGYVDREEMMDIYLSSDVLVYPSYYEELGYAVLEAMAHGLPVIASAIPSFNDLVIDGYNGFLIEPADYEKLASLLSILIEDEDIRHKMAERSSKYVKEKFDPKLVAQRFKDVIEDIRARVKG